MLLKFCASLSCALAASGCIDPLWERDLLSTDACTLVERMGETAISPKRDEYFVIGMQCGKPRTFTEIFSTQAAYAYAIGHMPAPISGPHQVIIAYCPELAGDDPNREMGKTRSIVDRLNGKQAQTGFSFDLRSGKQCLPASVPNPLTKQESKNFDRKL